MNILLIMPRHPNAMAELILHGLRTTFGDTVVDIPKFERAYDKNHRGSHYGLSGILPDIPIDRTEIKRKIADRFFDLIIYTCVYHALDYLDTVVRYYKPYEVAFNDGEDNPRIGEESLMSGAKDVYNPLKNYGVYFKRESNRFVEGIHPLSLAYPEEYFYLGPVVKTQDFGTTIPGNMETYIFTDAQSYWADYQKSYFGLTWKKAGWDCYRNLEIIANKCVPYWLGKPEMDECPPNTMWNFPWDLMREAVQLPGVNIIVTDHVALPDKKVAIHLIDFNQFDLDAYTDLQERFFEYGLKHLTTKVMVQRLLDIMESKRRKYVFSCNNQ